MSTILLVSSLHKFDSQPVILYSKRKVMLVIAVKGENLGFLLLLNLIY